MATDKQPKADEKPNLDNMTLEERVKYTYEHGNSKGISPSIQDIARANRLTVDEVLHMIGQDDLLSVETTGDMIDADEAGYNANPNYGERHKVNFTTN